jgi:hypothetical protein
MRLARLAFAFAFAATAAVLGCNSPTGIGNGSLTGTYSLSIVQHISFPGSTPTRAPIVRQLNGWLSVSSEAANGAFLGTYFAAESAYSSPPGSVDEGGLSGVALTGGKVIMTQFGDSDQVPLVDAAYLSSVLPNCDYQRSAGQLAGSHSQTQMRIQTASINLNAMRLQGALQVVCANAAGGLVDTLAVQEDIDAQQLIGVPVKGGG